MPEAKCLHQDFSRMRETSLNRLKIDWSGEGGFAPPAPNQVLYQAEPLPECRCKRPPSPEPGLRRPYIKGTPVMPLCAHLQETSPTLSVALTGSV